MSGPRLARAAALIAGLTVLARVAGFARTTVLGRTVGATCVGTVYQTANTIPNIVFDIVAGGLLSALVVPVLAPALAVGDRERADQLVSAMLSWAVVVLVPVAAVIALAAGPVVRLLLGPGSCDGAVALGTRMLVVFAAQVVFYGVGVVLGGVLTAAERFTWPALAPLLSSLTVIAAYLLYAAIAGNRRDARGLPVPAELALSVGTTAGVVVLACCQVPAVRRAGIRVRPTLRFPSGVATTVRTAAVAGAATLAAQEISTAVMIRLANAGTARGTLVVLTTAQTVFLLPWAVLSLPVATAAYPGLAAAWDAARPADFGARLGTAATVVVTAAAGGTALLVAVAQPAGPVLLRGQAEVLRGFAPAVSGFAIGLLGWSLVALLSRALYAAGAMAPAAAAQVLGQLVVIAADVALSVVTPAEHRTLVLAAGNSVGVTVAAVLLIVVARRRGVLAAAGPLLGRVLRSGAIATPAAGAGWLLGRTADGRPAVPALGLGVAAAVLAAVVYLGLLAAVDRSTWVMLTGRLKR